MSTLARAVIARPRSEWTVMLDDIERVSRRDVRMAIDAGFGLDEVIWMLDLPARFSLDGRTVGPVSHPLPARLV